MMKLDSKKYALFKLQAHSSTVDWPLWDQGRCSSCNNGEQSAWALRRFAFQSGRKPARFIKSTNYIFNSKSLGCRTDKSMGMKVGQSQYPFDLLCNRSSFFHHNVHWTGPTHIMEQINTRPMEQVNLTLHYVKTSNEEINVYIVAVQSHWNKKIVSVQLLVKK